MLLVDDDEPEVGEGQEQRRARPHHQPRVAARHREPRPPPRRLRHPRVPLRGPGAEARLDPVEELDRERDLGQEHQRLPPAPQRLGDRLEIDLGLPRPGDPLEQRRRIAPRPHRRAQRLGRRALRRRQRPRRDVGVEPREGRVARRRLPHQHALRLEPLDHPRRDARERRELHRRQPEVAVLGEGREHPRRAPQSSGRARSPNAARAAAPRAAPRGPAPASRGAASPAAASACSRRRGRETPASPARAAARRAPARSPGASPPRSRPNPRPRPRPSTRRGPSGTSTRSPRATPPSGGAVVEEPVEALGRHHRHRRAGREAAHRRGAFEVFHRAIPWASIPPDHKG